MSKEALEVFRGISQAMGYAYDGATDEVEEPSHPYVSQDDPLDEEECESCVL